MRLEIEFSETDMTLQADFGELYEKPQKEVYDSGYNDGYEVGNDEGYDKGKNDGYSEGYTKGEQTGYNNGYTTGKTDGYNEGYGVGESKGYENGYDKGYDVGFGEGKESASGGGGASIDSLIDDSITVIYSEVETIRQYAFYYCTKLTTADFPLATSIGNSAFYGCANLMIVRLSNATTINGSYVFRNCSNLTIADFSASITFPVQALYYCSKLKILALRSEKMCTLSSTNALQGSGVENSNGYIYVPSALISSYKTATNWSRYSSKFRALEDYTVDGTITGELDETKIGA